MNLLNAASKYLFILIVMLVGAVLLVTGISKVVDYFRDTDEMFGHVIQRSYSITRNVESYMPVYHENWENEIPSLAYNTNYMGRRVHHYHDVPYSSTCEERYTDSQGNRRTREVPCTKYRSEPVYANWYSYILNEWVVTASFNNAQQTNDDNPILYTVDPIIVITNVINNGCPAVEQSYSLDEQPSDPLLGCQREGVKQELYWLTYIMYSSDESYSTTLQCQVQRYLWTDTRINTRVYGVLYTWNNSTGCDTITFNRVEQ